jgi:hypothetical protein
MQQHTVRQQSSLNPVWQLIWKRSGPERIKAFLWATAHDRLMINENRKRGFLTDNPLCHNCPTDVENTLHVLRECPLARMVWKTLLEQKDWMGFFNTELISRPPTKGTKEYNTKGTTQLIKF